MEEGKKIKNLPYAIGAIVIGTLLLRIFIPWWVVSLLMGTIAVLVIYFWTVKNTLISEKWGKRIITTVVIIFTVGVIMSFVELKYPWLAKAFDDARLYLSFIVTDQIDPKYPDKAARSVYQTERMKVRAEENRIQAAQSIIQQKLAKGIPLTADDEAAIEQAKKKLPALDKELAAVNLARPKTESGNLLNSGSWPLRMMALGFALMAAAILISKKATDFTGKGLAVFIGLVLFVGGAILFTFPEVQAKVESVNISRTQSAPAAASVPYAAPAPSINTQLPANANLITKIVPGERKYFVYGHIESAPPELWVKDPVAGNVVKQKDWPANSKIRWLRNPINNPIEIYAVLPPDQNISVSERPPEIKQAARVPTTSEQQHLLLNVVN